MRTAFIADLEHPMAFGKPSASPGHGRRQRPHMGRTTGAAALLVSALSVLGAVDARAGSEPFVGQLQLVGYNYCPNGFAEAAGQTLSISQNTALFSLLGTNYGGNGQTTFALPDLRGRTAIGSGQGPGLSNYSLGESAGSETFTLTLSQMPAHNHPVNATSLPADKPGPLNKFLASDATQFSKYSFGPANIVMAAGMIGTTGGSQPVGHRSPYSVLKWCIALQGIFPSRP